MKAVIEKMVVVTPYPSLFDEIKKNLEKQLIKFNKWLKSEKDLNHLLTLDDRLLRDIGISRSELLR